MHQLVLISKTQLQVIYNVNLCGSNNYHSNSDYLIFFVSSKPYERIQSVEDYLQYFHIYDK